MHEQSTKKRRRSSSPILTAEAFWAVGVRTDSGCFVWPRTLNNRGYGQIRIGNRLYLVHRVASELVDGSIPDGIQVLHRCDNPPCYEPAHLFRGTFTDNMHDMTAKGRHWTQQRPETVRRGAAFIPPPGWFQRGSAHNASVLTEDQIRVIRQQREDGWTLKQIGEAHGVHLGTIWRIVKGQTWGHVQ